jgi:hypothetical protein
MKSQSVLTGIIIAVFAFFAIPAGAQVQQPPQNQVPKMELSDNELKLFMEAAMEAQTIQMESQQEMIAVVDKEGIEVDTFNEIIQAKQLGQPVEELDISEAEIAGFDRAFVQIQEIEVTMGDKMTDAVEEKGMDMDRFQEINIAISQDPELQERVQQMVLEMQMQMQQQPEQQE